jgi:hypothetical protein
MNNEQLLEQFRLLLTSHAQHTDEKLNDMREEFNSKIDPMNEYFITAKTNLNVLKYFSFVGGGVLTVWLFVKDWVKDLFK